METLFLEAIHNAQQQKKLIAVYTDKDSTDNFSAGYVNAQIEEGLLLQSFDPNGFEDGLIFFNVGEIYLIETDNTYLKNLGIIISESQNLEKSNSFVFKRNKNERLINDFLNKCFTDKLLVTLKLYFGKGVSGFINKIDEETICLNVVTDEGENDGMAYFKVEDIERIYLNGIDQRRMNILLTKNK